MHFILSHWPLTFICAAMIVAAVIDGWKLKVPNWLTFPLILSGWGLGVLHSLRLAGVHRRRRHRRQPAGDRIWASRCCFRCTPSAAWAPAT